MFPLSLGYFQNDSNKPNEEEVTGIQSAIMLTCMNSIEHFIRAVVVAVGSSQISSLAWWENCQNRPFHGFFKFQFDMDKLGKTRQLRWKERL